MKIGIFGKNARHGASLASLADEVVDYEEQGFASYWMQQASTFDALIMMGVLAHSTSKIELGIATIPTYPRYPGALVHQAWTVNVLAGGRLVLGVGPTAEPEYEELGSSYDESVRHLRDYTSTVDERIKPWREPTRSTACTASYRRIAVNWICRESGIQVTSPW